MSTCRPSHMHSALKITEREREQESHTINYASTPALVHNLTGCIRVNLMCTV